MAAEPWKSRRPWPLLVPLGVYALLLAWIGFSAAAVQGYDFSYLLYALANLIVFTDSIDFGVRLYVHRRHTAVSSDLSRGAVRHLSIDLPAAQRKGSGPGTGRTAARPWAIIASVFNLGDEVDEFMERLEPYREHIWLISDGSTDNTAKRLQLAGWRCLDEEVNRHKPGALRHLLSKLPPQIETVMVIDPDVKICGRHEGSLVDLERVIADLQQSGAAAACPRIAIEPDGFLARFQMLEYTLACVVGAVILLHDGERIYYDGRLVVSGHGPHTFRHWYSQRVGWFYGLVRVYTQRSRELWRIGRRTPFAMYTFVAYMGVLGLGLHVLRIAAAALLLVSVLAILDNLFVLDLLHPGGAINPVYFAAAIGSYLILAVIALFTVVPRRERAYVAPILPLYFLYALVHTAPMTVGFGNWVALRLWGRRLYRDHYQAHEDDTVRLPRLARNGFRAPAA
ncbi:MAG: glycosyltransferase family 2 protein [Gammaproteobacteria bacterium]|nr:MAG: glycosyltransferase family 2 protein [Gammaproteobacteria bacterium]